MLKVIFEFRTDHETKKQFNGYPMWHNITNEASTAWKMKELFKALNTGSKSAIDFDDKGVITRIGSAIPGKTELLIKTKAGSYNGQPRAEIDVLLPLPNSTPEEFMEDLSLDETSYDDSGSMANTVSETAANTAENDGFGAMADEQWAAENEPPF
jgi:hypothetical protein